MYAVIGAYRQQAFFYEKTEANNILLRCFGAHIGTRVTLRTANLCDYDLISIGDGSVIGEGSIIQPHTFENREMKFLEVHIGKNCMIHAEVMAMACTVLRNCEVEPLSVIMSTQTLPEGSHWGGSLLQEIIPSSTTQKSAESIIEI